MGDVVSLAVVHFLWDFSPTFLSDSKRFQFCKLLSAPFSQPAKRAGGRNWCSAAI